DPERPREACRHRRERLAPSQRLGPHEVEPDVAVPELEPSLAAERAHHLARVPRLVGAGIEARLKELVETGEIAELTELERELSPELIGLGRYLGIETKRAVAIGKALGVTTAAEFREAA